jgi:hypothetical protein
MEVQIMEVQIMEVQIMEVREVRIMEVRTIIFNRLVQDINEHRRFMNVICMCPRAWFPGPHASGATLT